MWDWWYYVKYRLCNDNDKRDERNPKVFRMLWVERQTSGTICKPKFDRQSGPFLIFSLGNSTLFRLTYVNGALATFWRPVLSIGWIITRPQLKFISLGLFNRLTNHYYNNDKYGQQNEYTTYSHGYHRTVTHIWNLLWRRFCSYCWFIWLLLLWITFSRFLKIYFCFYSFSYFLFIFLNIFYRFLNCISKIYVYVFKFPCNRHLF